MIKFLFAVAGALPIVAAVSKHPSIPKPSGKYFVGQTQHLFNYTTLNDPVWANGTANVTGKNLMITVYYPSLNETKWNETEPYLDPINDQIWDSAFQYPNGSLISIKTRWNFQAPVLTGKDAERASKLPTILYSPGGGMTCWGYGALFSDLASHGYTVVAIDHPGEAPYLQYPYGEGGRWGIDIYYTWPLELQQRTFEMRVNDLQAMIHELYPPLVELYGAPFNTSSYIVMGHSIGGAAAAEMMAREESVLAGINFDGRFWSTSDVQRPFLMMSSDGHNASWDTTWATFPANQSGWWEVLTVNGSLHLDYSDISFWPDILHLDPSTTPSNGPINGLRMTEIVRYYTRVFVDFVLGKGEGVLAGPSKEWPEVLYINGSEISRG